MVKEAKLSSVSRVNQSYQTKNSNEFQHMSCSNSYFPYTDKKICKLSPEIRTSVSHEVMRF